MIAVDTNILVYAADASEPEKQRLAVEFLEDLWTGNDSVILPWQVAVEYVACLRRWEARGRIERRGIFSRWQTLQ